MNETPDQLDTPGGTNPLGIDDPTPDAEYLDEPERPRPCDDCESDEATTTVRCPVDEDLRLDLCADCLADRGPGLSVCHVTRDEEWDVNGGRRSPEVDGAEKRHMNSVSYPTPGWIGNPHEMEQHTSEERQRVLRAFKHDLMRKLHEEEMFALYLGKLRGKRVACWCRSESESWGEGSDGRPCHLDVVNAALLGLYREEPSP